MESIYKTEIFDDFIDIDEVENWYSSRGYNIYDFQTKIVSERINKEFENSNIVILAAAPGGGKTLMSICYLDTQYLKQNPDHRVLILTHGTTVLRTQYHDELIKNNPDFTFDLVETGEDFLKSTAQVVVALPQTINKLKNKPHFQFLICDEAHQFYLAENKGVNGMVKSIIKDCHINKQLLLTGSPSKFIYRGFKSIIPVTVETLLDNDLISNMRVDICTTSYKLKLNDYNRENEVKTSFNFKEKESNVTLDNLLNHIVDKLKDVFKNNPRIYNTLNVNVGWSLPLRTLKKTMIMCRSINQAEQIKKYFDQRNINTIISHSDNGKDGYDANSEEIERFKEDKDVLVLIVVGRGILGFNYPELVNAIDLTCTMNIDRIFQFMMRAARKHPNGDQKLFFKVVPAQLENYFEHLMSVVLSLVGEENYMLFNGKNFFTLPIPTIKKESRSLGGGRTSKSAPKNLTLYDIGDDLKFFIALTHRNNEAFNTVSYTNLSRVSAELFNTYNKWFYMTDDQIIQYIKMNNFISLEDTKKKSKGFYNLIERRKLQKQICNQLGWKYLEMGKWSNMTDDEMIEYVKMNGFVSLRDITRKNSTLYCLISERKLSIQICNEMGWKYTEKGKWSNMTDDDIIQYVMKNNFVSFKDIMNNAITLYNIIAKRKLQKQICNQLGWRYTENNKWSNMTDDDIIQYVTKSNFASFQNIRYKNTTLFRIIHQRKLQKQICNQLGWKYIDKKN